MTVNLKKIALNLLIPFSGFYLTKVVPLSPIYFTFIAAILVYFVYTLVTYKVTFESGIFGSMLFLSYILLTQPFLSPNVHVFFNIVISLLSFIFGVGLMRGIDNDSIIKIAERFIRYSLILLVVEALWRIAHPQFAVELVGDGSQEENFYIYPYKNSSIMYQDSNFVGIFILCVYFLLYYIKEITGKKYLLQQILLILLTFATLSRAAIIALILFTIIFGIVKKFKMVYVIALTFILFVLSISLFLFYFAQDESFIAHLSVFVLLEDYLKQASVFHILFGTGFANAVKFFNMGSHNFLVTYIMDTGFVGILFLLGVWTDIVYRTRGKALYIILPFLLAGMSLAGHAIPFFYVALAIIYSIEKNKIKQNYASNYTI